MTTHTIALARHTAQVVGRVGVLVLGTWDSYGTEQLLLRPGPEWEGLAIDATFHNLPNDNGVTVLADTDGLVPVPPEACMRASKYATITFRGVQDGVQRISCNLPYMVLDHAQVPGANSTATPSENAQALAQMQTLRDGAVTAKAAAKQAQQAAETAKTDAEAAQTAAGGSADAAAASAADAKKTLESIPDDYSTLSGKVDENANGIRELKEDIADKLDKPANPVVGQVLRVKSIDEAGKIVLETAAGGGSGNSQNSEAIKNIEIVETQGKFAKWVSGETSGGVESSVTWASHSQFIPVVHGETLRISCRAANACPGIVFYKTNTMSATNAIGYALDNPGTGDPVTGSTNRYTFVDKDVVVPDGAFYAILNNAEGTHEWKCQKVSYISGGNTGTVESEKLEKVEYENEQLSRRLINAEKHNDFTWGTFDKAYFVFIHDDSREFITTAYNAFHAKGAPVSSAAIAPYLGNTYSGKTVKEWLDLIVADGGEVLCHYSYDLKDSDDDSLWYQYVVDAKREFERNGFEVRGMILAGSSTVNSAKGEKFCRKYFDYADKVGTSTQYNLGRKLMLIFDSLDAFKQRIDSCARTPGIYAFGFHGNRDDETWITEDSLKEIIDYISAKDNCEITTYGAVFDKIGTTVLEKRIAALENV